MPKTKKQEKPNYVYAVGRRREAIARVRLFKGKGEMVVNDRPIAQYFPSEGTKNLYFRPFEITKTTGKYYATIRCSGGGKVGQLEAVVHGLSRALSLADKEQFRSLLKKGRLLTRDSRTRERRKVGMGGKARRKRQSPKR